nr:immunoglobulin light chain junction region [Macaca mulatta]
DYYCATWPINTWVF